MSTSKIDRLKQQLAEAEKAVVEAETTSLDWYHDNLKEVARRDKIARKLKAAIERENTPRLVDPLSILAVMVAMCVAMWILGCVMTWGR